MSTNTFDDEEEEDDRPSAREQRARRSVRRRRTTRSERVRRAVEISERAGVPVTAKDITINEQGRPQLREDLQREVRAGEISNRVEGAEVSPDDLRETDSGFELRDDARRRVAAADFDSQVDETDIDPADLQQTDSGFELSDEARRRIAAADFDDEVGQEDIDPSDIERTDDGYALRDPIAKSIARSEILSDPDIDEEDVERVRKVGDGYEPVFSDAARREAALEDITEDPEIDESDIAELQETDEGFEAVFTTEYRREQARENLLSDPNIEETDVRKLRETNDGFEAIFSEDYLAEQIAQNNDRLDREDIQGVEQLTEDEYQQEIQDDIDAGRLDGIEAQERWAAVEDDFADDESITRPVLTPDARAERLRNELEEDDDIQQEDVEGVTVIRSRDDVEALQRRGTIGAFEAQELFEEVEQGDEAVVRAFFTDEYRREQVIEEATSDEITEREDIERIEETPQGWDIEFSRLHRLERIQQEIRDDPQIDPGDVDQIQLQDDGAQISYTDEFIVERVADENQDLEQEDIRGTEEITEEEFKQELQEAADAGRIDGIEAQERWEEVQDQFDDGTITRPVLTPEARAEQLKEQLETDEDRDIEDGDIETVEVIRDEEDVRDLSEKQGLTAYETQELFEEVQAADGPLVRPFFSDEYREERAVEQLAESNDDIDREDIAGIDETREGWDPEFTEQYLEEQRIRQIALDNPDIAEDDVLGTRQLSEEERIERIEQRVEEGDLSPGEAQELYDAIQAGEADPARVPEFTTEYRQERFREELLSEDDIQQDDIEDVLAISGEGDLQQAVEEGDVSAFRAQELYGQLAEEDRAVIEPVFTPDYRAESIQEQLEQRDDIDEGDVNVVAIADQEDVQAAFDRELVGPFEAQELLNRQQEADEPFIEQFYSEDFQREQVIQQIAESDPAIDEDDIERVEEVEGGYRPVFDEEFREERTIDALIEEGVYREDEVEGVQFDETGDIERVELTDTGEARRAQEQRRQIAAELGVGVGEVEEIRRRGGDVVDVRLSEFGQRELAAEQFDDQFDVDIGAGDVRQVDGEIELADQARLDIAAQQVDPEFEQRDITGDDLAFQGGEIEFSEDFRRDLAAEMDAERDIDVGPDDIRVGRGGAALTEEALRRDLGAQMGVDAEDVELANGAYDPQATQANVLSEELGVDVGRGDVGRAPVDVDPGIVGGEGIDAPDVDYRTVLSADVRTQLPGLEAEDGPIRADKALAVGGLAESLDEQFDTDVAAGDIRAIDADGGQLTPELAESVELAIAEERAAEQLEDELVIDARAEYRNYGIDVGPDVEPGEDVVAEMTDSGIDIELSEAFQEELVFNELQRDTEEELRPHEVDIEIEEAYDRRLEQASEDFDGIDVVDVNIDRTPTWDEMQSEFGDLEGEGDIENVAVGGVVGSATIAPEVGRQIGDGWEDVIDAGTAVEDQIARVPGVTAGADLARDAGNLVSDFGAGIDARTDPVTDPVVGLSRTGQEAIVEDIDQLFNAIDAPGPVQTRLGDIRGAYEVGAATQGALQRVGKGATKLTVGAPANLADAINTTADTVEYAGETISEEGITEGTAELTGEGLETVRTAQVGTVRAAREDPATFVGNLIGATAVGYAGGAVAGRALYRGGRFVGDRVRTAGGQYIDPVDTDLTPQNVLERIEEGKAAFPGAENPDLYQRAPSVAVRQQARRNTPDPIRQQFDEAGVDGVTLMKGIELEPDPSGRIPFRRSAKDFDTQPGEFESPGAFAGPQLSPHFLRINAQSPEFSPRPGLPNLGNSPTAVAVRTEVEAPDADDLAGFRREMLDREGETIARTKPRSEVNVDEIEAVIPPESSFVDVNTGPLRDLLRRAGIGADFYTEVAGRRVPIRTVAPEDELTGGSRTIRDLLEDERAAAGVGAGGRRVSRQVTVGYDVDPGTVRPLPLVPPGAGGERETDVFEEPTEARTGDTEVRGGFEDDFAGGIPGRDGIDRSPQDTDVIGEGDPFAARERVTQDPDPRVTPTEPGDEPVVGPREAFPGEETADPVASPTPPRDGRDDPAEPIASGTPGTDGSVSDIFADAESGLLSPSGREGGFGLSPGAQPSDAGTDPLGPDSPTAGAAIGEGFAGGVDSPVGSPRDDRSPVSPPGVDEPGVPPGPPREPGPPRSPPGPPREPPGPPTTPPEPPTTPETPTTPPATPPGPPSTPNRRPRRPDDDDEYPFERAIIQTDDDENWESPIKQADEVAEDLFGDGGL